MGLLGEHELSRDGRVRASLRYKTEHLALSRGKPGEAILPLMPPEQRPDDDRIEDGAAAGDPHEGTNHAECLVSPVLEALVDRVSHGCIHRASRGRGHERRPHELLATITPGTTEGDHERRRCDDQQSAGENPGDRPGSTKVDGGERPGAFERSEWFLERAGRDQLYPYPRTSHPDHYM